MKVPKIFVPEKDLANRINEYLEEGKSLENKNVHIDPNLNYMLAMFGVLQRLEGKGIREIEQDIQEFIHNSEDKRCIYLIDFLETIEHKLPVSVSSAIFKKEYTRKIDTDIVSSYLGEEPVIQNRVMDYVNMVIGIDAENLGPNKVWRYIDPKTKLPKTIKIDMDYMCKVEKQLGLNNANMESFRQNIRKIYGMKLTNDPHYNFMDNIELVEAVTDVILKSDMNAQIIGGTLANKTNEETKHIYERVIHNMITHHGYCKVCAEKTLEYFCTRRE